MFKIAIDAGHGLHTAGKRCMKAIDPNETREWVLNSRIAEKLIKGLSGYDCGILRIDDPTGKTDISLKARTDRANKWGADLYLSIHHNAGIGGGTGGGTVAYVYPKVDRKTKDWQKALYDSLIKHTGLRGNRSNPLAQSDLHVLRETNMPAVLIENGFMDSTTDTSIILTGEFADKSAAALLEAVVAHAGLKRKESPKPSPEKIAVIYQVWDDVQNRWLPNVKDLEDYAGIFGHDVCCVYANLSDGSICYRVHIKGGGWLPIVTDRKDYAGIFNRPIDAIAMLTDTGRTIHYAVHLRRKKRWLPYVTGSDINDSRNGYAGILGEEIDGIKIYIE